MSKIRNLEGRLVSSHEVLLEILEDVYNGASMTDNYEYLYKLADQNKLLIMSKNNGID